MKNQAGSNDARNTTAKFRSLWIADSRLDSDSEAELLSEFLKDHSCERLYVAGSLFGRGNFFHLSPVREELLRQMLATADAGSRVYCLDDHSSRIPGQFMSRRLGSGRIRLVREAIHTTADGRRLLVKRHPFDGSGQNWAALAGSVAMETLSSARGWLQMGRELIQHSYGLLSAAMQQASGSDQALAEQCHMQAVDGIVMMDGHEAEIRHIGGSIGVHSCGDWAASRTLLTEDFSGHIEILCELTVMPPGRAQARSARKLSALVPRLPPAHPASP